MLTVVYNSVCEAIGGKECYEDKSDVWEACSTDMGDIAVNFPAIHPYSIGATGNEHGKDYAIPDPAKTCGNSALLQLALIHSLLENGAAKAKVIKENFKPVFPSVKEYVAFKKSQTADREMVRQNGDGSIVVL